MKKIVKFSRQIETLNARYAKGYEGTLDFNHGYISGLRYNKIISRKDSLTLMKVYANHKNENCRYAISKSGKLIDYGEESD